MVVSLMKIGVLQPSSPSANWNQIGQIFARLSNTHQQQENGPLLQDNCYNMQYYNMMGQE